MFDKLDQLHLNLSQIGHEYRQLKTVDEVGAAAELSDRRVITLPI